MLFNKQTLERIHDQLHRSIWIAGDPLRCDRWVASSLVQNAVLDGTAVERKSHVGATVVERDHLLAGRHDKYCAARRRDYEPAPLAYFADRAHPNEAAVRRRHFFVLL